MIRHESVITALIGGALGISLGIVLGALLAARVDAIDFSIPVGSLIVFVIAAIVVGAAGRDLPGAPGLAAGAARGHFVRVVTRTATADLRRWRAPAPGA